MTTTTLPQAVAVGIVDNDGEGMEEKKITSSADIDDGEKKKEEVKVRVGTIYPVTFATTLAVVGVNDVSCSSRTTSGLLSMNASEAYSWAKSELTLVQNRASVFAVAEESNLKGNKGGGKKKKKSMDDSLVLKAFLLKPNSGVYHYGPSLIEHCIATAGIDPLMKLTVDNMESMLPEESWTTLLTALQCEGNKIIENLTLNDSGGYILYTSKAAAKDDNSEKKDSKEETSSLLPAMMTNQNPHSDKTLLEFQPHLLQQHKDQQYLQYTTFTKAVDEFFSHLSSQRMSAKADAAENAAHDRLAKIKVDQQRRIDGLVREQEEWMDSARLVETHATDIDRALGVINSALDSGIDWDSLDQLVLLEQGNNNPIALLIHKLLLDKDQVVLALPDVENWDESSNPDSLPPIQLVTISIKESAHGNARAMFSHYRSSKEKGIKTVENTSTALKAAEAKARQQLDEAQKKKLHVQIAPQRRTYWFEKFAWFITSDNYLVVAGRDAQQNEQLVKRYLRPGDAYLHAEVHGAATCILRAKRQRRQKDGKTQVMPLSDQALREAGHFTICRSAAWTSKMVTSAYWVESHQVSKTAPTGEYLTVGSFMIRGRKNFLPPSTLEMGLGVLFRLGDDASIARHANERRDFALIEQDQMFEQQDVEELDSGITEKDIEKLTINVDDDVDDDDEDKNDVEEEDHDDNDNNEQELEEENDTSLVVEGEHKNVISPSTDALKSYESVISGRASPTSIARYQEEGERIISRKTVKTQTCKETIQ
jgi:predicted ribosome quality control (RQC) complex YloA/Tae2 family protein